MAEPVFLVPDWQNFSCTRCTACCTGWSNVLVTQAERAGLLQQDWPSLSPRLAGHALFEPLAARIAVGSGLMRLESVDGRCVFLDDDRLCLIHKTLGYAAKPLVCRMFPLIFVNTPSGVVVSTSYASTAVLTNTGQPLTSQMEWIRDVYTDEAAPALLNIGGEQLLSRSPSFFREGTLPGGARLEWQSYAVLEGAAMRLMDSQSASLGDRLLAVGGLLAAAGRRFPASAPPDPDPLREWAESTAAMGVTGSIAQLPRQPAGSGAKQRAVVGLVVSLVEREWLRERRTERLSRAGDVISTAMAVVNARGPLRLLALDAPVDLEAARRVDFPQHDPSLMEPVTRFIKALLLRKFLLVTGNLWEGYLALLTSFALVRWHSQASAAARGCPALELADVHAGLRAVERSYTGHRPLFRILLQESASARWFRPIYRWLASPHTLVRQFRPPGAAPHRV